MIIKYQGSLPVQSHGFEPVDSVLIPLRSPVPAPVPARAPGSGPQDTPTTIGLAPSELDLSCLWQLPQFAFGLILS